MKLFYAPGSCALAPHIIARELALPVEIEKVSFADKKTESGADFLAINPKGAVPALKLETGEVLTEVAVLLQYLAAEAPDAGLIAPEGLARWRQLELLNFISSELHKGFSPLFNPALPPESKSALIENLNKKFGYLESGVLGDKPFLAGASFTLADAYAFTVMSWAGYVQIDLASWPKLAVYQERMAGRPAVQQALREQGLLG